MENLPGGPFGELKWGGLRLATLAVNRIESRVSDILSSFEMVFKENKNSGLEFIVTNDPVRPAIVKSRIGTAELRVTWAFDRPATARHPHEELVARVRPALLDPLDLSAAPRTLTPDWELKVRGHGDASVFVGEHELVLYANDINYDYGSLVYVGGLTLFRAIAEVRP
ncbi:hypothetical protein QEP15_15970 [Achromobacter mucicolens]|uniref:hypothetical protein n=1 Tax=Achromobacter mucicolens TaxID=1389922 RepID=UPI002452CECE|nr:hypothetical protein [Achromobacter mucicolens]WGJ88852.1 hypothetical protein QEP15_15970 [Achromobacter mucicolens]